jgi:hypothetical protein
LNLEFFDVGSPLQAFSPLSASVLKVSVFIIFPAIFIWKVLPSGKRNKEHYGMTMAKFLWSHAHVSLHVSPHLMSRIVTTKAWPWSIPN